VFNILIIQVFYNYIILNVKFCGWEESQLKRMYLAYSAGSFEPESKSQIFI
jgi:hypothetical protein